MGFILAERAEAEGKEHPGVPEDKARRNFTDADSRIDRNFPAGQYTIEATTYFPGQTGTFHLSIGYFGSSP